MLIRINEDKKKIRKRFDSVLWQNKKKNGSTKNQIRHQIDAEIGYNNISQNIAVVNSNYTPDKVKLINY